MISLEWVKTEKMTGVDRCQVRTTQPKTQAHKRQRGQKEENKQQGLSIGCHLLRLITFAFYCVTEEMMKMADENSGDTRI